MSSLNFTNPEVIYNINFKKEIVKKTIYKYDKIMLDVMDFESYHKALSNRRKTCFVCGRKFKNEDMLSVLFDGNKTNTVCCNKCACEFKKGVTDET